MVQLGWLALALLFLLSALLLGALSSPCSFGLLPLCSWLLALRRRRRRKEKEKEKNARF